MTCMWVVQVCHQYGEIRSWCQTASYPSAAHAVAEFTRQNAMIRNGPQPVAGVTLSSIDLETGLVKCHRASLGVRTKLSRLEWAEWFARLNHTIRGYLPNWAISQEDHFALSEQLLGRSMARSVQKHYRDVHPAPRVSQN